MNRLRVNPPVGGARRSPSRKAALVSLALVLTVVLVACRTAPPPPPPPADAVVANLDPLTPVATLNLAPGETRDFQLNLPAGVTQARDVIYLELASTQNVVLELRGTTYWHVIASSASPERFVSGVLTGVPQPVPTAAAPSGVGSPTQQAVVENTACRGPCVIFAPTTTTTTYYARVVNDTAGTVAAELYLYGYDLQDDREPQNDARSTAPVLAASNAGALEVIGDVDFWLAPGHLSATLTVVPGVLEVGAVVVDASGVVVDGPFVSGEAFEVYEGEYVRVRAATGNAAAPAKSTYYLETTPLPGNPTRPPNYIEVTANNSGRAVDSRTVPAGRVVEYRVSIPATVRSRDVVYFEIDRNLGLELRSTSNLSAIASSSSPNLFGSGGTLAFSADTDGGGNEVAIQAVTANRSCLGSCIIAPANANSLFLRVHGSGASTNFTLFVYGFDLLDGTEPANDARATAPVLVGTDSGAIETIGDVDMWRVATTGRVAFSTVSSGPSLQAAVLDVGGNPIPGLVYTSGSNFCAYEGETIRVSASNSSQAAVSARSTYYLESGAAGSVCATSLTDGRSGT